MPLSELQPARPAGDDRVVELDVLRGVALFGVLLVNLVGFARYPLMSIETQIWSLPTAAIDGPLQEVIRWLVAGKAYSVFAFLFGLGFYLQWQRVESRGAGFERIYLRRLTVLLLFGVAHALFIWVWDILHLYALAGFALFAMRHAPDRSLLRGGIVLAVVAVPLHEAWMQFSGSGEWHGLPSPYTEEAVLARQAASVAGGYGAAFRAMLEFNLLDWLLSGLVLAWFGWSLGRFMIGAWVGRRGWFQDARAHLPGFRRWMRIALPAGLVLCGIGQIVEMQAGSSWLGGDWAFAGKTLHQVATPLLALGYVCAIVAALHTPQGRRCLTPFADVGRMALTNYVSQSFVIGFVLFGVGPGLGLAGQIGTTALTAIVIVTFALQIAFSRWWLGRYRYGPLEWLWRALTYGQWPALRRAPAQGAVA